MYGMFIAELAILFHFRFTGLLLLILGGRIISTLAFLTGHKNYISHLYTS
jgi:hypothetical protein